MGGKGVQVTISVRSEYKECRYSYGGKKVQVAIGEGREYTYMYSDGREEEDSHR